MSIWLRQSTNIAIKLGPFVDSTDGFTAETALTITQSEVRLSKNGGDIAQKSETTAAAHDEIGYYDILLNTTDTDTLGPLLVAVNETGALPVWQTFMVVSANVWDSFFGSDRLLVEVDDIDVGSLAAIADAVLDEALTEPSTVFAWGSATLRNVLAWLGALSRNRMTQTSTESVLRNDANSGDIATSDVSDDGTTFTRDEWS